MYKFPKLESEVLDKELYYSSWVVLLGWNDMYMKTYEALKGELSMLKWRQYTGDRKELFETK